MHVAILKSVATTALWAALLGASAAAHAVDYFLEIDGLDGESTMNAQVRQWQWPQAAAGLDFNPWHGGFAGGVKVAAGDLDSRTTWDELVLSAYHHAGGATMRYKLKDVIVSSYQAADGKHDSWIDILSFSSATMNWWPPAAGGGRGEVIEAHWGSQTGGLLGNPATLGALDELHAERWADGSLVLTAAVPEPGAWALMLAGIAALGWRQRRRHATPA